MQLADNARRRSSRSQYPHPASRFKIQKSALDHRRYVWKQACPCCARDGESPQLAFCNEREEDRGCIECHLNSATHHVHDCTIALPIGHMDDVGGRRFLEQLRGEMRYHSVCCTVVQSSWIFLGVCHEFLNRFCRHVGRDDQNHWMI